VLALVTGVSKHRTDGAEAPGGAVTGKQTLFIQNCRDRLNTKFLVNIEVIDAPDYLDFRRYHFPFTFLSQPAVTVGGTATQPVVPAGKVTPAVFDPFTNPVTFKLGNNPP